MRRHLMVAGLTGGVLYLVVTAPSHGGPIWPYEISVSMLIVGAAFYFLGQERPVPNSDRRHRTGDPMQAPPVIAGAHAVSQKARFNREAVTRVAPSDSTAGNTGPVASANNSAKAVPPRRSEAPGLFTHCQRCGYPFGAPIRREFCNVRQACDRRLREPGYRVPKGRRLIHHPVGRSV